jgi:hypothetical protein
MIGRRYWRSVVLVALLAASGLGWGLPAFAGADQAVTLQLKGEPGEEARYRTEVSVAIDMQAKDPSTGNVVFTMAPKLAIQALSLRRIDAVAPNGDLTVGGRLEAFTASFTVGDLSASLALAGPDLSPARFPRLPELPVRTVMSPRGALVSIAGLENLPIPPIPLGKDGKKLDLRAALPKLIAMFSRPTFPDHPVRPGESWQTEFTMDPQAIMEALGVPVPAQAADQMKALKTTFTITSTLTGFEMMGGVRTAVIRIDAPWQLSMPVGPPGGPALTESGHTTVVTNFDYTAGRTARDQTAVEFLMSVGSEGQEFVHMAMKTAATTNLVP